MRIVRLLTLYTFQFFCLFCCALAHAEDILLLHSAEEAASARIALVHQETKELRASYYILKDDVTGRSFLSVLKDAAERGVKVKLLVDAFGTRTVTPTTPLATMDSRPEMKAIIQTLLDSGVEIRVYHPPAWLTPIKLLLHNFRRMHDKLLITEGHLVTGDRNVADEYFGRAKKNFVSHDILVRGEAAQSAAKYFDEVWNSKHVKPYASSNSFSKEALDKANRVLKRYVSRLKSSKLWTEKISAWKDRIRYAVNASFVHDHLDSGLIGKLKNRGSKISIIEMIDSAKERIEIINPYVTLTMDLRKALQQARARGVKIQILTNSVHGGDNSLVALAFDDEAHELLRNGVQVYAYENTDTDMIHSKTMTIDGKEAYVGSYNLDPRSEALNLEVGIRLQDEATVESLTQDFERLRSKARLWNTTPPNKACHVLMKYLIVPLLRDQL